MLTVLVTAANVHDTTGGKLLLDSLTAAHPNVSKGWAEGGYQNPTALVPPRPENRTWCSASLGASTRSATVQ